MFSTDCGNLTKSQQNIAPRESKQTRTLINLSKHYADITNDIKGK